MIKLQFGLEMEGIDSDVKVARLALNEEHINAYNLPKAPKHGEACVELDALEAIHPGALAKVVEDALMPYHDSERPRAVMNENQRIRDVVKDMLENLRQPLQDAFADIDIAGIAGELDLTDAIDPEFEPPEPEHEADDGEQNWMFDSLRDYWDQMVEYKKYKGEREEEVA